MLSTAYAMWGYMDNDEQYLLRILSDTYSQDELEKIKKSFSNLFSSFIIAASKKHCAYIDKALFSVFSCNIAMGVCMSASSERKRISSVLSYAFFCVVSRNAIGRSAKHLSMALEEYITLNHAHEAACHFCDFFSGKSRDAAQKACVRLNTAFIAYDAAVIMNSMDAILRDEFWRHPVNGRTSPAGHPLQ